MNGKFDAQTQTFLDFKEENKILVDILKSKYTIYLKYRDLKDKSKYYFVEVVNFRNFWYKEDEQGKFKTLFGVPCSKTYNYHEAEFEKDIRNDYRFLIEFGDTLYKEIKEENLALIYYDIETRRSLDIRGAEREIISVGFYSNITNKYYFYYLKNKKDISKVLNNLEIKCFEDEREMLREFMRFVKEHDLILGFNNNFFDDLYLINRARRLDCKEELCYFGRCFINESVYEKRFIMMLMKKGSPISTDVNLIDIKPIVNMLFERGNFVDKPTSYSLDEIAKILKLEEQKLVLKQGPATLWEEDKIEELMNYNLKDVRVTQAITKEMKIIDLLIARKNIFKINFNQIQKNSRIIDYLLLSKCRREIVFPTISYSNYSDGDSFKGPDVLEPQEGILENVGVFDFNALYPNIIINFNISPETLVDIKERKFSYENEGVLTKITKFLLQQRYKYKNLKKELFDKGKEEESKIISMIEYQYKDCVNSLYGVFGYVNFRLYNKDIAESITFYCRELLGSIVKYIKEKEPDFEVIGGDTDSSIIHYKKQTTNLKQTFDELENRLNGFLKECWSKKTKVFNFKIECETLFTFLIFPPAKKCYIGLAILVKGLEKKNEMYAKGFALVKKDTPAGLKPSLRVFYEKFLYNVRDKKFDEIKKDLKEIKKFWKTLSYKDFFIVKQMNAEPEDYKIIPQHVRAMEYSNKNLGTNFSRANYKGGMVYVKVKAKFPKTEVIMLDEEALLPSEMNVDLDKYFEMFIENKIILLSNSFEFLFSKNKSLGEYS